MTTVPELDVEAQAPTGSPAVLAVDDEPAILSALSRLLRPQGVTVVIATSGDDALQVLEQQSASIGVIVSDYSMPGMNGAELLQAVRLGWPDITRVLLTGNADLPAAARAVNEGQLSRLYTKPWKADEIRRAIAEALEQYRMVVENRTLRAVADEQAVRLEQWNQRLEGLVAERTAELEEANVHLQRSLLETVRLLLTALEHRLPQRAARCKDVARLAARLAERARVSQDESRRIQVAALVHDVGLISLPDSLLRRAPAELSMGLRAQYQGHTVLGQRMLSAVEELTDMATWIRHHHERWDGRGYPDALAGNAIPLPSRIIALADGYLEAAAFETGTAPRWRAAQEMSGAFDPELLRLLDEELRSRGAGPGAAGGSGGAAGGATGGPIGRPSDSGIADEVYSTAVSIESLRTGMVLVDQLETRSGTVLLRAGERLTADRLQRVQQFHREGHLLTATVEVAVGTLVTDSAPPLV